MTNFVTDSQRLEDKLVNYAKISIESSTQQCRQTGLDQALFLYPAEV